MSEVQVFNFEGSRGVRVIIRDGEPWFAAKDVCGILELVNVTETLRNMPDDERFALSSTEGKTLSFDHATAGVNLVNEPGVYRLIFQSRKPEAEMLKRWIFHEVLPSIRKTGKYVVPKMTYTRAEIEEVGRSFFIDCYREGGLELYLRKRYEEECDPRNRGKRKLTAQEKRWLEEAKNVEFLTREGRL
jgi:prophage antirepressor-like protein